MNDFKKLPDIPSEGQTPLVQELIQIILDLQEVVRDLHDEILRLKGLKGRPKIKKSNMDDSSTPLSEGNDEKAADDDGSSASNDTEKKDGRKKSSKPKQSKNATLSIHKTEKVSIDAPSGAKFKGYKEFTVQDLIIQSHNTRYLLEQWETANGDYVIAKAPAELMGGHFGPTLISFIIDQHFGQRVTQPSLLEQLKCMGVEISYGQLSRILTSDRHGFHEEKDAILQAGIESSNYLQVDDTGARHAGKNGYCTFVGNEFFSWFRSSESKSRINFLDILGGNRPEYVLNAGALEYIAGYKLPQHHLKALDIEQQFSDKKSWEEFLDQQGITGPRHRIIATEGAMIGRMLSSGFPTKMTILSDDAGQFNVFDHALCWIHAERGILKLNPISDDRKAAVESARKQIWGLYADLKLYKLAPDLHKSLVQEIRNRFDELCTTTTCYPDLNDALKRLHRNKDELLRVLDKPWIPLHNNLSESDIREYVQKRKISGGTRSEEGRRCRDTFASLRKTCRKHGVSFWEFLKDRIGQLNQIPLLSDVIRNAAHAL